MTGGATSEGPASLVGVTIRRAFSVGRLYLVIAMGMMALWEILLVVASPPAFAAIIPGLLPIFGSLGALGGVMVFTNDRVKGVYEYLLAYGVLPRRIAANILIACLASLSLVLGVDLALGLGLYVASGNVLTWTIVQPILLYSLPMAYATAVFAATVGMFWTSLSSPRAGMNSPIGLVPIIGIAPPFAALILGEAIRNVPTDTIADGAVVFVVALVLFLLSQMERLMPRERLLSPA